MDRQIAKHIINEADIAVPARYILLLVTSFIVMIITIILGIILENSWYFIGFILIPLAVYAKEKQINYINKERQRLMYEFNITGKLPEDL